jgi:hypothetical protein
VGELINSLVASCATKGCSGEFSRHGKSGWGFIYPLGSIHNDIHHALFVYFRCLGNTANTAFPFNPLRVSLSRYSAIPSVGEISFLFLFRCGRWKI